MEPADKEIIKMLEDDNKRLMAEKRELGGKLYDTEMELHRYRTAFKLLVGELATKNLTK